MMLIAVSFPATALIFFGGLINLINFQIIDFSTIYNKMLFLDANQEGNNPLNSQFELMGYQSLFIIQNFGMLCLTIFLPIFAWIFAPVVVKILKGKLAYLREKSKDLMFFNFWIGFFDETYLFLTVCSGLNLRYNFKWQTFGEAFNCLVALIFGIILVIYPFFVAIFYYIKVNYDRIEARD